MIEKFVKGFRRIMRRANGEFMSSLAKGMIYGNAVLANGGGISINANL